MAVDVFLNVGFKDAGPTLTHRRYRLAVQMDDDGGNIDAVLTARDDVITALDVLTWDHITDINLELQTFGGGASANIASNNDVEAFTRTTIPALNDKKSHISVPAWDDATFDKDSNNLLSAAYNTAVGVLNTLLVDVETGEAMEVQWSQSRGLKRGQRKRNS